MGMVIVDERDAVWNPVVRTGGGVVKLVDDRRRKLAAFFSAYAVMLLIGLVLCALVIRAGIDVMVVVAFYFGFVGGLMTYYGVFKLGRARACWVYPAESLVLLRRTWFGLCYRKRWFDLSQGALVEATARLRGKRNTRNPLAWLTLPVLLLLGPLGLLFGVALERQVLLDARVLCIRVSCGRIEAVVVARGEDGVSVLLAAVESVNSG